MKRHLHIPLLLTAMAPAQITLNPDSDPLTRGSTISVQVEDATRAGQSIVVTIDNGSGEAEEVEIDLDAGGEGAADWTVPTTWDSATFRTGTFVIVRLVAP